MKPEASLSLDLDNQWSYMKVHADPGWESFPSYLDTVVPRALRTLADLRLKATFFIVGQDADLAGNLGALGLIARSGHGIGNHSFAHEPWLHRYTEGEVEAEIAHAEEVIVRATGVKPVGFRGPGFSVSRVVLRVLQRRGYLYDASTLPTYIGPLARAYYFMTAHLGAAQKEERGALFGTLSDGLRPIAPYRWRLDGGTLVEIPVTTFPVVKAPFHLSYVLYLSTFSEAAARHYFRSALAACRLAGVGPSLLLHPLDFLGGDDVRELAFFPAMGLPGQVKVARVAGYLEDLARHFDVLPLDEFARRMASRADLPEVPAEEAG